MSTCGLTIAEEEEEEEDETRSARSRTRDGQTLKHDSYRKHDVLDFQHKYLNVLEMHNPHFLYIQYLLDVKIFVLENKQ